MSGQNQKLFTPGTKFLIDGGDSSQVDSDLVDRFYGSKARVSRISVDAIDANCAAVDGLETVDGADQRGLPGA